MHAARAAATGMGVAAAAALLAIMMASAGLPGLPPRPLRLGAPRAVYSEHRPNITIALGMAQHNGSVYAAFGSWHTPLPQASWASYVVPVAGALAGSAPPPEMGGADGHETVGEDIVATPQGVAFAFEASADEQSGGPALYRRGLSRVGSRVGNGTHWWQGISFDGRSGTVVAAAARRFSSPLRSDVFLSRDGGLRYERVGDSGAGIPVHQLGLAAPQTAGIHLVFRTGYTTKPPAAGGSPALVIVNASAARQVGVHQLAYTGLPADVHGVNTAAEIAGVEGLLVGSYSKTIPWRGGGAASIGRMDWRSARTSAWLPLNGSDVTAVLDLGGCTAAVLVEDGDGTVVGNAIYLVDASGTSAVRVLQVRAHSTTL